MSANGIDNNTTGYQSSKLKGERYLKKRGLEEELIQNILESLNVFYLMQIINLKILIYQIGQ